MEKIGLVQTIDALRSELARAIEQAKDQDIQFELRSIQLEFQVGVTWEAGTKAGLKFWVLELGADGNFTKESVQKVTLVLDAPLDGEGNPIKITRESQTKP